MNTKISRDILDGSEVAGYVEEKVPWVIHMDALPVTQAELEALIARMPIGGLVVTNETPTSSDTPATS